MRIQGAFIALACVAAVVAASNAGATHTCRKLPAFCEDPQEAQQRGSECASRRPVHRIDEVDARFDAKACGWAKDTLEVVSGVEARPGTFNETVLITAPNSDGPPCSGVLIARRVVLTARHCFRTSKPIAARGSRVIFGNRATNDPAFVRIVDAAPAEPSTLRDVDRGIKHPDIVLLRLDADAPVEPIRVAASSWIEAAIAVRAVGFGVYKPGSVGRKFYGDLIAVSNACKGGIGAAPDSQLYRCMPGGELVAAGIPPPGASLATDTCNGDSGGPIFAVPPSEGRTSEAFGRAVEAGEYFLAGTTSRGIRDLGCGGGGIYTLIAGDTLAWIQQAAQAWGQQIKVAR